MGNTWWCSVKCWNEWIFFNNYLLWDVITLFYSSDLVKTKFIYISIELASWPISVHLTGLILLTLGLVSSLKWSIWNINFPLMRWIFFVGQARESSIPKTIGLFWNISLMQATFERRFRNDEPLLYEWVGLNINHSYVSVLLYLYRIP
jgi:hypothetical protein